MTELAKNEFGLASHSSFRWCDTTFTFRRSNSWSGFVETFDPNTGADESRLSDETAPNAPLNPAIRCVADLEKTMEDYKELLQRLEKEMEEMEEVVEEETASEKHRKQIREQDRERLASEKRRIVQLMINTQVNLSHLRNLLKSSRTDLSATSPHLRQQQLLQSDSFYTPYLGRTPGKLNNNYNHWSRASNVSSIE